MFEQACMSKANLFIPDLQFYFKAASLWPFHTHSGKQHALGVKKKKKKLRGSFVCTRPHMLRHIWVASASYLFKCCMMIIIIIMILTQQWGNEAQSPSFNHHWHKSAVWACPRCRFGAVSNRRDPNPVQHL